MFFRRVIRVGLRAFAGRLALFLLLLKLLLESLNFVSKRLFIRTECLDDVQPLFNVMGSTANSASDTKSPAEARSSSISFSISPMAELLMRQLYAIAGHGNC